jgi:nucleotide-binding universal stress UspA family protein
MSWVSRIVVPIDVGKPSLEAVDLAVRLAGSEGEVTVVHVLPILTDYEAGLLMSTVTDENRAEYARSALHKLLSGPQYAGVQVKVLLGDPGHEIADFAAEQGSDLIVLPSHRHTGINRLLIGSVAERVVRLATCPVLVLKHPRHVAAEPAAS